MNPSYFKKNTLLLTAAACATSIGLVQAEEVVENTSTPQATSVVKAEDPQATAAPAENLAVSTEKEEASTTETNGTTPSSTKVADAREERKSANTSSIETKDTAPVEGQTVDVRILATTDLHTNLVNYDYYQDKPVETLGLAKTAVLIEEAKKENSNVILVDNGDTIQGTPLGTYKAIVKPIAEGEQHPMYAALQALGFDAGTLGNHEFNYGLDYLSKVLATAGMPLVNANVVDPSTGKFIYEPYKIINKTFTDTQGKAVTLKIGITGIVPPQILNWDKANLAGKVVVNDSVEAVQHIIPVMRQAGADLVVVLSHSGIGDDQYEKGEENTGYQIASLAGVDAVITGHSHAEFPSGKGTGFYEKYKGVDGINGKINGTPVTMAGKYGDHLGVIDLNLTYTNGKWGVTNSKAAIRKIDTKSSITDARILEIAKNAHEGTIDYVRQQVGTTTAPITSYFALVKDDPSVQIVNNAQRWYALQELAGTPEANLPILSAAAPFKAGTRGDASAYTDIPAGAIAIKNVADLYLYDNVTAILKVTGAQLKEWLEMSAGQFNQIDPNSKEPQQLINMAYRTYNFDVIDGITYQFDITQPNKYDREGKVVHPEANRVQNLKYQGKAVDPHQEFIVVTNNYRANGRFPGVREASLNRLLNLENRQAIINYILSIKTINPSADNNWAFANTIKDLDLRFLTADRAKNLIQADEELIYLGPSTSSEGFGEFRYRYVEPTVETVPIIPPTTQSLSPLSSKEETLVLTHTNQHITLPNQTKPTGKQIPKTNTLPQTGHKTSFFSLLGLVSLTMLGSFKINRKR